MWLKRLGKEVEFLWEGKQLEFSYDLIHRDECKC